MNSTNGIDEQGITYLNNGGFSSHINLLEDFSPNRTNDVFRWIPQGLMYDLMDNRNEAMSTGGTAMILFLIFLLPYSLVGSKTVIFKFHSNFCLKYMWKQCV